jgi:recombination protein RecA
MALPAHVLERLPPEFLRHAATANRRAIIGNSSDALSQGLLTLPGFEEALPEGGLLRGAVVELSLRGAAALGTLFSLAACRAAQSEARALGGESAWCAFIDPSGTLHGPGVVRAEVELERLLVVRPSVEALGRVALRVVESRAFDVVVVDTVGSVAAPLNVPLGPWARIVRRLSTALEGSRSTVLLLTDQEAPKPLTLPVAQRLELCRKSERELLVTVGKDRRGLTQGPHSVPVRSLVPMPGLRRTTASSSGAPEAFAEAFQKEVAGVA